MKPLALLSLLLSLVGTSVTAHAEGGTCPNGYYPVNSPGVMGCAPIPGYNHQQAAPQPPPPRWEDRWGAIATDGIKGVLGSAADMVSRREAESAALIDCQAKGGSGCKLDISYSNGCGAMVVGDHGYSIESRSTKSEASEKATKACSAKDTNCHAYFSTCSPPARTR